MSDHDTAQPAEQPVWDALLRALHWLLAASVIAAWLLGDWLHQPDHEWHEWLGYLAWTVAVVRLGWGLIGPRHARFTSFVQGPVATSAYTRSLLQHREPRYLGHNPLGGWMVVALLANVIVTAVTGWLGTTDAFWGEPWVQDSHAIAGQLFLPLVGLHVAGVVFTSWRHRESLVRAMVTGRKRAAQPGDID